MHAGLIPGLEYDYTVVDNVESATQAGSSMILAPVNKVGLHPVTSSFKVTSHLVAVSQHELG